MTQAADLVGDSDNATENRAPLPPYPGLRPFQPDDSEYFFGRDSEVREVVRRLKRDRFVAVIGGSGCGKSSLVLAGAIPRLRSFAIEEAGDFWVPISCTPGTNHVDGDTPLRRLARKFCSILKPSDDESVEQRISRFADVLRQPNGLAKLVSGFGNEVANSDGMVGKFRVNYLLLIDQFEEIFHRSNTGRLVVEDCAHLVDRIVEHSQGEHRHPQICVALTMRSEHLNDCPRYPELPDAINRAFYLVKRLNGDQLREVIQQPALRYLRRCVSRQRELKRRGQNDPAVRWPSSVQFEGKLVERIIHDAESLLHEADHADQLPLLQHLLFWIWAAARQRSIGLEVPATLTMADLEQALRSSKPAQPGFDPLAESVNTLKACLENRCDAIYEADLDRRETWEPIFRRLAFREPGNGTYTQQRVSMPALCDILGMQETAPFHNLATYLEPWLKPHGYLHWDVESRTVKVAHEALIRRWSIFRDWVDSDDRQFRLYVRLLEECREWSETGESERHKFLSSGNALILYENSGLPEALKRGSQRGEALLRLLERNPDARRLRKYTKCADDFLVSSIKSRLDGQLRKQQEREEILKKELEAQSRTRRLRAFLWWCLGIAAFGGVVSLALSELSKKEITLHRSYAMAAETQSGLTSMVGTYDQPQVALLSNMQAMQFFLDGRAISTPTARAMNFFGPFQGRLDSLRNAELLSEARTTSSVRSTLIGTPWVVKGASITKPAAKPEKCNPFGTALANKSLLFFPPVDGHEVGLLIAEGDWGISLFAARNCSPGETLIGIPANAGVRGMRIGGSHRNVVIFFGTYTQYHSIDWTKAAKPHSQPRGVIYDSRGAADGVGAIPSQPVRFGEDIQLAADTRVRLFDAVAGPVGKSFVEGTEDLVESTISTGQSVCGEALKSMSVSGEAKSDLQPNRRMFALAEETRSKISDKRHLCLLVTEVRANGETLYLGELFGFSGVDAARDPERRFPVSEGLQFGLHMPTNFKLNVEEGWLAYQTSSADEWKALPWSMQGWRSEAAEVFRPEAVNGEIRNASETRRAYDLLMNDVKERLTGARLKEKALAERPQPKQPAGK